MTPAARAHSAIGLLSEILPGDGPPADAAVRAWFRRRRYAGSKDRAAVTGLVFQVLRRRGELTWALEKAGGPAVGGPGPRLLVLAALVRFEGADLAQRFDGSRYGPDPLSAEERAIASRLGDAPLGGGPAVGGPAVLRQAQDEGAPGWVRGNYPENLEEALRRGLGEGVVAEMEAMGARAPVDLRVNTLQGDRAAAQKALGTQGIETEPTPLSPVGLRVSGRARVAESAAFRGGLVEVQDEGAQLAALLVDARPGHCAVDFCAGAGGKTLALAAAMAGEGILHALDADGARLAKARGRLKRAGITGVRTHALGGSDDPAVAALHGAADRVLVDVPCTGSGTWRRAPEAKWRTDPASIATHAMSQRDILSQAVTLVRPGGRRPGGRLIYVTCSIFAEENTEQAAWFLDRWPQFRAVPMAELWPSVLPGAAPGEGPYLQLTPLRTGTDGFFVAVFEHGG